MMDEEDCMLLLLLVLRCVLRYTVCERECLNCLCSLVVTVVQQNAMPHTRMYLSFCTYFIPSTTTISTAPLV